jgi:uncharacterized protein
MKQILIYGASGRVGGKVAELAQEKGYAVKAFMHRNPINFTPYKVYTGSVLNYNEVEAAMEKEDLVIYSVGKLPSPEIIYEGMENVVKAMKIKGLGRIIYVAAAGILQVQGGGLRRDTKDFPSVFLKTSAQHLRVFGLLKESGLQFTIVCPPYMPTGELTGKYRHQAEFVLEGMHKISAEDVADFIVKEIDNQQYLQSRVSISY